MKHQRPSLLNASLLLTALMLACLAVPAAAGHDEAGVTLFQHVHFRGQYETFFDDVPNLRRTYLGNDCASSIVVPRGCQVTLYSDADFRGAAVTFDQDVADLRHTQVGNDEVSSLSVSCYDRRRGPGWNRGRHDDRHYDDRGYDGSRYYDRRYDGDRGGRGFRGVTLYSDAGFGGRYESFRHDDPDLRDNPIRQDTTSSIAVTPGCRAILYIDVGFRGAATEFTDSSEDLRYSTVGNDRVSSIQVDCGRR